MGRRWRAVVLSVLLASFATPSQLCAQQNQLGKIIGNVRVVKGDFPPHPVLISLEMRGAPIGSAYCDDQGRFGFYSLVANEYQVSVNDDARRYPGGLSKRARGLQAAPGAAAP